MAPVTLYAHRGAPTECPENTLVSFRRALERGATALELDVHRTQDGVIVVSHDPTGARAAGQKQAIESCTFEQLQTWDAGWGFEGPNGERPYVKQGIKIPTFEQVIEEFATVQLNVDLKVAIAAPVVELVHRHNAQERICLASFQQTTLQQVRALGYQGRTSLAQNEVIQLLLLPERAQRGRWRPPGQVAQLPLWLMRTWVVKRCHALGLRVDVWTVNERKDAERMLAMGVDGIMTDDPQRIAPVVQEWNRRSGT
jgi:glycerophosphoryl diester phosphodiesterase